MKAIKIRHQWFLLPLILVVSLVSVRTTQAVYWNNDPNFGTTAGTSGLTDMPLWFPNDYIINNTSNNTRGTTILLNNEWALSVRHVVQNGSDFSTITSPGNVNVAVSGATVYGSQIFTPDGGSEISLTHLRGGIPGAINLLSDINTSSDEIGRVVEIGGWGFWGVIDTTQAAGSSDVAGTGSGAETFHRAYNVATSINGLGQITIGTGGTGNATLKADGLVQGIGESGDSGGPMFAFYGTNINDPTQANNLANWRLVGLTATATALGSGNIVSWGASANYTRVSNFSSWINSTIAANSFPASVTGAWVQDAGTGLYDDHSNVVSVTNTTGAPVIHSSFGSGPNHTGGYTMSQVGQKIVMTAMLSAPLVLNDIQFRFGMFNDVGGTIAGNVSGGTPWQGYFVGNAIQGFTNGVFEKGSSGGGVGQWWSQASPNSATVVNGFTTSAMGSFTGSTPAGIYSLSLTYTREATGLEIDWAMSQIDSITGSATSGVYSFTGSILDATPASSSWTYDELGFFLFGSNFTGQMVLENVNVAFVPEPSTLVLLAVGSLAAFFYRCHKQRA